MNEGSTEKRAAKALLFFCDDMEPKAQWERAVDFLRSMDHMQKAQVWNLMTDPEIGHAKLSKRRTAYKRAIKEAEESGFAVSSNSGGDSGTDLKILTLEKRNLELLSLVKTLNTMVDEHAMGYWIWVILHKN